TDFGKVPTRGDSTGYSFQFLAVPVHAFGSRDQNQFLHEFRVVVEISRSLQRCGDWRNYSDQEMLRHLFAFAHEALETNGLPPTPLLTLQLLTTTDNGRFERGSPYSIASINPNDAFVIPSRDDEPPMSPEQKQQLRTKFLSELYKATGGKTTRAADKWS